jgi:peptide-methionine (S)-S-oxide reductase
MVLALLLVLGLSLPAGSSGAGGEGARDEGKADTGEKEALFAGGCFWCMESPFDGLPGVVSVTAGYTGGTARNPSYEDVSAGWTGHAEAVRIVYDPSRIRYETLLRVFWRNVDPTDRGGQFCDRGSQYRAAVFYTTEEQRRLAVRSREELEGRPSFRGRIAVEVAPAGVFWRAEEYHQHYYRKNPIRYAYYRASCGRDGRLGEIWGSEAGGK